MIDIIRLLSSVVVVGFCLFLIGLAALVVAKPPLAERFLLSFASSARAHYTEQGLRLLVGAAIVTVSSSMRYPEFFRLFGWLVTVSAAGLLLTPWTWHQKLGERVLPHVIRHMRVFALGAATLGMFVLYGLSLVLPGP